MGMAVAHIRSRDPPKPRDRESHQSAGPRRMDGGSQVDLRYSKSDEEPIKATIKLIKIKPFKEVVVKEREFIAVGDEKTAFRFKTDENGNIIEVNELPAILTNPLGE